MKSLIFENLPKMAKQFLSLGANPNMALFFWDLIKSDLSSLRYCTLYTVQYRTLGTSTPLQGIIQNNMAIGHGYLIGFYNILW